MTTLSTVATNVVEPTPKIGFEADLTKVFSLHVFCYRKAPEQSKVAGQICCELRCPIRVDGEYMAASAPLIEGQIQFIELERYEHPIKNYKILRFTCSVEDMTVLYGVCCEPTTSNVAEETRFNLMTAANDAVIPSLRVSELKKLAKKRGIEGVSKMKKAALLAALCQ